MIFTLVFATLSPMLVLTSCERRLAVENIEVVNRQQVQAQKRVSRSESVREGMTMKEVAAVLGEPKAENITHGKVRREVVKEFDFATWTYEQDGQRVELSFVDGKLQDEKVPKFGEKLDPKAPLKMNKEEKK